MATNNGRNPFLLNGDDGFHVETVVGANGYKCKYLIAESFRGKNPFKNVRGGEVYQFTISIIVDLCAVNANPRPNYLFLEIPQLDDFRGRSNDPRDFLSGYPFDQIWDWTNLKGEKLIEWAKKLEYSKYFRPSYQDCNGDKSPHDVDRERFAREIKGARRST